MIKTKNIKNQLVLNCYIALKFKKIQFFKIIEKMTFFEFFFEKFNFFFKKGLKYDKQTEFYQKNSKKNENSKMSFFCLF